MQICLKRMYNNCNKYIIETSFKKYLKTFIIKFLRHKNFECIFSPRKYLGGKNEDRDTKMFIAIHNNNHTQIFNTFPSGLKALFLLT